MDETVQQVRDALIALTNNDCSDVVQCRQKRPSPCAVQLPR